MRLSCVGKMDKLSFYAKQRIVNLHQLKKCLPSSQLNKIRKGDTLKIEVFLQNCQASASWTCDLHVVGQNIANPFVIYFTLWVVRRTLDKG